MYRVNSVAPSMRGDDIIEIIGHAPTKDEAIEVLRNHLLDCNQRLLDLSPPAPEIILKGARANVENNAKKVIEVRDKDGVVFIDGNGPEMDYYTITDNNEELLKRVNDSMLTEIYHILSPYVFVDVPHPDHAHLRYKDDMLTLSTLVELLDNHIGNAIIDDRLYSSIVWRYKDHNIVLDKTDPNTITMTQSILIYSVKEDQHDD